MNALASKQSIRQKLRDLSAGPGFLAALALALVTLVTLAPAGGAWSQAFPARPIRLVIPTAAGGLPDAVARSIQETLESRLGQRLVVENRAGAGGNIGAQAVAVAAPDGYTLCLCANNNLVINPFLFKSMGFDPMKDLIPVSLVVDVPLAITVNPSLPVANLREFVEYARSHPGRLNYGSPGPGTPPHLATELLAQALGIKVVHVPYKGGGAAMNALLANEIQFIFIGLATVSGQVKSGQLRPIAVAAATRLGAIPAVPTFAEAGFGTLEVSNAWWGVFAPRGTDRGIVEQLARHIRASISEPLVQQRLQSLGLTPVGSTPEELASMIPAQAERWEQVIRASGIVVQ